MTVDAQVHAFGQVLSHKAIRVLVGASLPRAVRVTEVHRHARVLGELFVQCHLFALVVRQALAHGLDNALQLVREGLHDVGRTGKLERRELDQYEQAAGALDQGAHSAGVASALDEVTFPVPWELAVFNLGWPHMDAEHVWDLATAIFALATRQAFVLRLA